MAIKARSIFLPVTILGVAILVAFMLIKSKAPARPVAIKEKAWLVSAEQVQKVAEKYLVSDGLTVAELVPQPIDPARPPRTGAGGSAHGH